MRGGPSAPDPRLGEGPEQPPAEAVEPGREPPEVDGRLLVVAPRVRVDVQPPVGGSMSTRHLTSKTLEQSR